VQQIAVLAIIFLAVLVQSISGFGSALVAMALLPAIIGLQSATPLVALVAITLEVVLLIRYRKDFQIVAIWPVALASILGIPLGILYLRQIDERITLTVLGLVILGYAIYSLANIRPPVLKQPVWGIGAGFLAGMLGGAYNTSGPPVIVYGDCKRWEQKEFKGNLQGFFVISSSIIAAAHLVGGSITQDIWYDYLLSLPIIAVATILGTSLDKYLDQVIFRRVVLFLLVIMGLRMILSVS
jgi:uncharacterized membrane protein YfcA